MGEGRKVLFTNCGLEMWEPRFNGANDLLGGAEARMSSVVHVHGCTQPAAFAGHVPRASSMPGPAHPNAREQRHCLASQGRKTGLTLLKSFLQASGCTRLRAVGFEPQTPGLSMAAPNSLHPVH